MSRRPAPPPPSYFCEKQKAWMRAYVRYPPHPRAGVVMGPESTLMAIKYEPATWFTKVGTCLPGTVNLSAAIKDVFPELSVMSGAFGCYNDRPIMGSDVPSLHREGRALDVGVPSAHRGDGGQGWACACALSAATAQLGVQLVLWSGHTFRGYGPPPRLWREMQPLTARHLDHLHVELRWRSARDLTRTFATRVLRERLAPPGRTERLEADSDAG